MGANIKLKIDPADKILLKRNLNRNGKGQQFFTHEVRRLSDCLYTISKRYAEEYRTGTDQPDRICAAVRKAAIL